MRGSRQLFGKCKGGAVQTVWGPDPIRILNKHPRPHPDGSAWTWKQPASNFDVHDGITGQDPDQRSQYDGVGVILTSGPTSIEINANAAQNTAGIHRAKFAIYVPGNGKGAVQVQILVNGIEIHDLLFRGSFLNDYPYTIFLPDITLNDGDHGEIIFTTLYEGQTNVVQPFAAFWDASEILIFTDGLPSAPPPYDAAIANAGLARHLTRQEWWMSHAKLDIAMTGSNVNGNAYDFHGLDTCIMAWQAKAPRDQWYLQTAMQYVTNYMNVAVPLTGQQTNGAPTLIPNRLGWPNINYLGYIRFSSQVARLCYMILNSSDTTQFQREWANATVSWFRDNVTDTWSAEFFANTIVRMNDAKQTVQPPGTYGGTERAWLDRSFISLVYAMYMLEAGDTHVTRAEIQSVWDIWSDRDGTGAAAGLNVPVTVIDGASGKRCLQWDLGNHKNTDAPPAGLAQTQDTTHAGSKAFAMLVAHELGYQFPANFVQYIVNTLTEKVLAPGESYEGSNYVGNNYINGDNFDFLEDGPYEECQLYHYWAPVARANDTFLDFLKGSHAANQAGLGTTRTQRSPYGQDAVPAAVIYAETHSLSLLEHTAASRWAAIESSVNWNHYVNRYIPNDPGLDSSLFAWNHWYYGATMASHYRRTQDATWLNQLLGAVEIILPQRADRVSPPLVDGFTNSVRPVWMDFAAGRSPARWHGWGAHCSRALEHALYACSVIKNDAGLNAIYGSRADAVITDATATLAAFDGDYQVSGGVGKYEDGYFTEYSGVTPLPFNLAITLASSYIWLWKATGTTAFKTRATELSQWFKDELLLVDGQRYEWRYAEYRSSSDKNDVTHANVEINVVLDSFEAELGVFDQTDIDRFLATMRHIYRPDFGFTELVDGKGPVHATRSRHVAYWLRLSLYDDALRTLVHPFFENLWESSSGKESLFALALYLEGD